MRRAVPAGDQDHREGGRSAKAPDPFDARRPGLDDRPTLLAPPFGTGSSGGARIPVWAAPCRSQAPARTKVDTRAAPLTTLPHRPCALPLTRPAGFAIRPHPPAGLRPPGAAPTALPAPPDEPVPKGGARSVGEAQARRVSGGPGSSKGVEKKGCAASGVVAYTLSARFAGELRRGGRAVEGTGLENRRAQASWVRIPPPPSKAAVEVVRWTPEGERRGGREAEGARLLSEYGPISPSRVRIPPSPLAFACQLRLYRVLVTRFVIVSTRSSTG